MPEKMAARSIVILWNVEKYLSIGNGEILIGSKHYSWNNWVDLLLPDDTARVLATYHNTDDSKLEKDLLCEIYKNAGATTEDYRRVSIFNGVMVFMWR